MSFLSLLDIFLGLIDLIQDAIAKHMIVPTVVINVVKVTDRDTPLIDIGIHMGVLPRG